MKKGGLREARRHLHRCLHSRDLLLQFVTEDCRERFSSHPRFAGLHEMISRITVSPALKLSTERLKRSDFYEGMLGRSPAMLQLFQSIERLRDQELAVLVTGETGTGKELVVRAIHRRSPRHRGPFRSVHCACLPSELFESELFGHVAGAFTDAEQDQPGLLEDATGGTLVLDEIGQLPLASQAKLLKVLEAGNIRRLGSVRDTALDVRFLATTSRDLHAAVDEGTFRADLYYRLCGVEIRVPPLSERREDIEHLARHFLEQHAARLDRPVSMLGADAIAFLERKPWPGNVRELEMLLLRALVTLPEPLHLGAGDLEQLSPDVTPSLFRGNLVERSLDELREDLERQYLTQLFAKTGGDTAEMMRHLAIKSTKFYSWLGRLGIDTRELRRRLGRKTLPSSEE